MDDLSLIDKILLSTFMKPSTDQELRYVYRNLARPDIPVDVLWDAEKGALAHQNSSGRYYSLNDSRRLASKSRGIMPDQTETDMPVQTSTGAIMQKLMNPVIEVPEYKDLGLWGNKKAQ